MLLFFSMLFLSLYRVCPSCSHGPFPCVLLLSITSLALAGLATEANPIQSLCVLCFSNLCCSTVNPSQRIAMMHECLCVFYLSNLLCSTVNPFQRIVMTHECLCILRFSNLCCSIAVILWSGLSEIILSKSSDTRSLKAECQKYQEVPIARTKASQTLHVCEL